MERLACESNGKKRRGRVSHLDENKNYDNRLNTRSLRRNAELKKRSKKRHRLAYGKSKAKRAANQVSATNKTDVKACVTNVTNADHCPVEASATNVTDTGDCAVEESAGEITYIDGRHIQVFGSYIGYTDDCPVEGSATKESGDDIGELIPLDQVTSEDGEKIPISVLHAEFNSFVEEILRASANEPVLDLEEIVLPQQMDVDFLTDENSNEETVNHLTGDALDNAITDLVLEIEEDLMKDDYHMEELVEFSEDLDLTEDVPKWVLKYGSANPLLSQETAQFERTWSGHDSDESDCSENTGTSIELMHCDVLQYLKALEAHLELDDFRTVKLLFNTLGSAEISVDCLIALQEEIFGILMKALISPEKDVVHSAKLARINWMATLSGYEFKTAKIAYYKLWLIKT